MSAVTLPWEQDAIDAASYWQDKDWKKFAVDAVAGPERKPTWRYTYYVGARSAERALAFIRLQAIPKLPAGARLRARLAGPRELGCTPARPAA